MENCVKYLSGSEKSSVRSINSGTESKSDILLAISQLNYINSCRVPCTEQLQNPLYYTILINPSIYTQYNIHIIYNAHIVVQIP